nr:M15 family metallopeptidase [uncultured Tolumonas sp.]
MINRKLVGLDDSELCPVTPGHFLTAATAAAFQNMSQAALADGLNIAIASSYRSFERQTQIWNRKCRGESIVLDGEGNPIANWAQLSPQERIFAILRWSALPGASRHHWGTDLDVYAPDLLPAGQKLQLTPAEYDVTNGYFAQLTTWLDHNMHAFGFFRPYVTDKGGIAPEAWHLSYYPEAKLLQEQFTLEMLHDVLIQNAIEENTQVLLHLPQIWTRFIINISENHNL